MFNFFYSFLFLFSEHQNLPLLKKYTSIFGLTAVAVNYEWTILLFLRRIYFVYRRKVLFKIWNKVIFTQEKLETRRETRTVVIFLNLQIHTLPAQGLVNTLIITRLD